MWRDLLLYAEHTYTSSGGYSRPESEQSVRQIETKHFHVSDARETAHWIAQESMSRLLDSIRIEPPATAVNAVATPWGQSLKYRVSGLDAPRIDVEIRLFNGEKKIEIVNRLQKEPVNDKEAIYFAFPFAAPQPEFEYEGQNGTVNPARDELAGGCREWYAAGHWARVSGGGISAAVIPIDAPLVTFGDINRGLWPEKFEPKSPAIFSYALNNYWHTNFPRAQSGEFTFRYVVTSGAELDTAHLSRLGRESLTPLETGELTRNDKVGLRGSLPATPASFLGLSGDGVELETLKPAEDGQGYIVRLLETAGHEGRARLSSRLLEFSRAWLSNATEDNLREIPASKDGVEVALSPYAIVTLRLLARPVTP